MGGERGKRRASKIGVRGKRGKRKDGGGTGEKGKGEVSGKRVVVGEPGKRKV